MATKAVFFKGTIVGYIVDETYVSDRGPKHFMRKFQGFGISVVVLNECVNEKVKYVKLIYDGKGKTEIFNCPLEMYLNSTKIYTDIDGDVQKFVSISEFREYAESKNIQNQKEVKMETKKNPTLDSWESFTSGSFLKTGNVESDKDAFVCINIELIKDARSGQEVMKPRLTLEHNGVEYLFDLNMTNSNFLKMNGMSTPKAVIGAILYFKKALVRDPKKGIEVESLRISRVEKK